MKVSKLFLMAVLVGTLAVIGCGSDDGGSGGTTGTGGSTGTGGGSGACTEGELCCIELCFTGDLADATRTVCLDEYSDCVDGGGDEGTCKTAAEETCTI